MSATILVHGKLFRDPERKVSSKGNAYAMATIRDVAQGADATWWRVFAFSDDARDELLGLRDGDGVAVSGTLRAEIYAGSGTPRVSLTITADRIISAKLVKREKAATVRAEKKAATRAEPSVNVFNDSVPF